MPITYIGGWVIVQGDYSASTNIFELIYNASVAGAWGIETQLRNRMQLAPTNGIQFGQAGQASATIYKSQNENVICTTMIHWGAGNATFPTTGTIGVYDAVNDLASDGCEIEFTTVAPGGITVLDVNSALNVYDSDLTDNQAAGLNSAGYSGLVEMVDVDLWRGRGWGIFGSGSNMSRIKANTDFFGILSATGQTWNAIRTNLCFNGMSVLGDGVIQDTQILNAVNFTIGAYDALGGGTFFDFINCDLDYTDFVYYNDHTRLYRRQFTIDMLTRTKAGTAIPGVRVRAWDATQDPLVDTPLFDVTTAAGGNIAQQLITVETQESAGTLPFGVYTDLNPVTFFINKIGWEEVRIIQTVLDPNGIDWTIEMTEVEPASLTE